MKALKLLKKAVMWYAKYAAKSYHGTTHIH